ncbi:hypothetical protein B296_00022247 [Ensete ventricosum]|uniref:Protein VTE6, chloroplastic n=1 Tax=Ensete ventricosum TaxID=4639 RepID=A0A427ADN5_ENSVE|nr:hypothetical protein B296_00022247 [Ensete ventricosum]
MASALLIPLPISPPLSPPLRPLRSLNAVPVILTRNPRSGVRRTPPPPPRATPLPEPAVLQESLLDLVRASPPTWESAVANNLLIFVVGSRILLSGLTASGIGVAFLLGTLSWRAFGPSGFLIVAAYFVINGRGHILSLALRYLVCLYFQYLFYAQGTAATKVKITQKEALGVAEKRRGRRGPGSVIGSGAAGCVCAFLSIYDIGGAACAALWQLGFIASFCTKLSDTVSSEIGKAYGKTT